MLFVAYPLLLAGTALALGVLAGLLAKANRALFYVLASVVFLAVMWADLRKTWRSKYEVCETQGQLSQWQAVREAWRLPEFRVAVAKLSLVLVEVMVLAALVPPLVRYVRNAL